MFARISRSWRIFKNSLSVLSSHKKLMVFPLLSAIFVIAIVMLIFGGIFATAIFSPETGAQLSKMNEPETAQQTMQVWEIIVLFVAYFISVFCATFFNVAFYSEIIHGLNLQPVSLMRGFKFAFSKSSSIAMWALLGATVGVALKMLEERFGWLGQLVIRLIGLAWNVVTIFAVPVIICNEDSFNPITNLKKSAKVIKDTWGESLIGFLGISTLNGLLIIPIVLLTLALAIALGMVAGPVLAVIVGCLGFIAVVLISMLLSVAQKIYIASLYLYATEGFLNEAYDEELMQNPWKVKR